MSLKETNPSKAETEYPVPIRATKRTVLQLQHECLKMTFKLPTSCKFVIHYATESVYIIVEISMPYESILLVCLRFSVP
jgi:hypothetical protein